MCSPDARAVFGQQQPSAPPPFDPGPLYPNGPGTPLPTINPPASNGAAKNAVATPSDGPAMTAPVQNRQLGSVPQGAGLNVPR